MGASAAIVAIRDLHKKFGEQTVLDGVTFDVAEGETLAVLGRSGVGKSVLLKIIVGLQCPDSGSVRVHGTELTGVKKKELNEIRKKTGFLFQESALYDSLTVEDNVAFPLRRHTDLPDDETKRKARELLKTVGMEHDLDKLPSQLSGGMQKRVGLARALALDPDVILFDEPTTALDPITSAEIAQLILQLKKERHIAGIVVTHDLHNAKTFADRVVLLQEGRIQLNGDFEDLRRSQDPFVRKFVEGCA